MATSFDAICWDFDGTVVDTERVWIPEEEALIRELGGEPPEEFWRELVGGSPAQLAELIRGVTGVSLSDDEINARLTARMTDAFATIDVPWNPGVRRLLDEAHAVGIPQALVSATQGPLLRTLLCRMETPFETVVAGDDVVLGKPHAEGYLRACAALGASPERVLVIEDSVPGSEAGNAAGCVVLAVPSVVAPPPAPRRVSVPTLEGLTLDDLSRLFDEGTRA